MNKENRFTKAFIQKMTAKEIVLCMISGLEKQHINVDLDTYGEVKDGICFGCAASNMACELAGKAYTKEYIEGVDFRAEFLKVDKLFLHRFEEAIDRLRRGDFYWYNEFAKDIGMAQILEYWISLPQLRNKTYKEDLIHYKNWAETL